MAVAVLGGGSGAVGTSTHAACARFRGTDPLVTGVTRRALAAEVKFPDVGGGIPEARWIRAMTFERLVRDVRFASQVATTTVGELRLDRPAEVVIVDALGSPDRTAEVLAEAHKRATKKGIVTVAHNLSVPFVGYEGEAATDVKPDFVVVAQQNSPNSEKSWLITGDAKDYERLRSRIEDSRLLKGFLQVAVGAESFEAWTKLPKKMDVHKYGVLAVPRNSFLQPVAVVEDLHDHREEIRARIAEREAEAKGYTVDPNASLEEFVAHLKATFDPATCTTCTLFSYCRNELETSSDPTDVLIEIGIPQEMRKHVVGLVDGTGPTDKAPASVVDQVNATLSGVATSTGQLRVDPIGLPGTINVVIAKSDAAALGILGMAYQRISPSGASDWSYMEFIDPQSPATRLSVMKTLGKEISAAMADARKVDQESPAPVHIVVPDRMTADVLVSIADNLAGVELSRLRWEQDKVQGRPALTYDGEPAVIPKKLSETGRTAVSFFLEDDRARAFSLRSPILDIRSVLARHVVAGGPAVNSGRLDYLVEWANSTTPIDHRSFGKKIEQSEHTPGARLSNETSNLIHRALTGDRRKKGKKGSPDHEKFRVLVKDELKYKTFTFEQAIAALGTINVSNLQVAYRALESDVQAVWRRRLQLHASDLVRFGRTYRWWRNSQVESIESDFVCETQLRCLVNHQAANDLATSAGSRELMFATVRETDPAIVLDVDSRRVTAGSRLVLLHLNGQACVEEDSISVDVSLKGKFKVGGLSLGPLESLKSEAKGSHSLFIWKPHTSPALKVDDRLILADFAWFAKKQAGNTTLPIEKPKVDKESAPKDECTVTSYDSNPFSHRYCCRSHENSESAWSDTLAERRAAGELNPNVWPPVRDLDAFEVVADGTVIGDPFDQPADEVPVDAMIDDLE
jgi:hypothetical protein